MKTETPITDAHERLFGDMPGAMFRMEKLNTDLLTALKSALRYIEVQTAYQGAMTADEVEAAIKGEFFPAVVSIGANSCNTLASFDFVKTRALVAKATGGTR